MAQHPRRAPSTALFIGLALGIASLVLLAAIGGCFVMGASIVGLLRASDDGVIQHTVVSPDQTVTAFVISDDCGATCSCQVRVDLKTRHRTLEEVYRSWEACDATVTWLSSTRLLVIDDLGQHQQLDLQALGLTPE